MSLSIEEGTNIAFIDGFRQVLVPRSRRYL